MGRFWYHLKYMNQFIIYLFFYNLGTFDGQALRTLHGDLNLGELIMPTTTKTDVN